MRDENLGPAFTAYIMSAVTTLALIYGLIALISRC